MNSPKDRLNPYRGCRPSSSSPGSAGPGTQSPGSRPYPAPPRCRRRPVCRRSRDPGRRGAGGRREPRCYAGLRWARRTRAGRHPGRDRSSAPVADEPPVAVHVETMGPNPAQRDHVVRQREGNQRRERQQLRPERDEPRLADQQGTETRQGGPDDQREVPVGIQVLLRIRGGTGSCRSSLRSCRPTIGGLVTALTRTSDGGPGCGYLASGGRAGGRPRLIHPDSELADTGLSQ